MGKKEIDHCLNSFGKIVSEIKRGIFKPFYLLMGEEPYYSDVIISEIEKNALSPEERGFNYVVMYGSDVTAASVVEAARRFPMMASRQLVILKEAQLMGAPNDLEHYFKHPMATTVLVVSFTGKSLDKRTSLYKWAVSNGCVLESFTLYPNMVYSWIERYLKEKEISIVPEAALLMAEHCGTELRKLVLELDKLITNLPKGSNQIDLNAIEENVGISRDYNIFELTKAISFKEQKKALQIVKHFGASPRQFPLALNIAALFSHFSRLLKYHSLHSGGARPNKSQIAAYIGINPYFLPEYEYAARNYPLIKCMEAISLIRRYDSKSKSFARGESSDGDILFELVYKILH
ncbi:MAG: DNA polymerase III subunit delta [Bacteroidales bacterium]